ncbi:MAG TPA: DUF2115 family protein [Methanocorpusculum sp.]|nr:DUF2115 family protein [Methanocorpusculum sp.]
MKYWNRIEPDATVINWVQLSRCKRKGELLEELKTAGALFTPDDLNLMMIRYDEKIRHLTMVYRGELAKYARIQITDGYNELMTASLDDVHKSEKLPKLWKEYATMSKKICQKGTEGDRLRSLKHLIAAFAIFIQEKPPHPNGMPFPGELRVERYEGVYYCPVKSKWETNEETFCHFCPALQSRVRDMELAPIERDELSKEEKLNNYFYNFKG